MNWTDILGFAAGFCTTVSVIPQIHKAWKTKNVTDISPFMFSILMLGIMLWIAYGIVQNDLPIIATNGLALTLNSVMLYLMVKYRKGAVKE